MDILNTVMGALANKDSNAAEPGNSTNNLMGTAMALLSETETGGLSGIVEKITAGGLGEHVASWLGNGENLPISAEQIQTALGSESIQNIAGKLGINTSDAAASLASFLPQLVDKLSPEGEMPTGNALAQQGMQALSSFLNPKQA